MVGKSGIIRAVVAVAAISLLGADVSLGQSVEEEAVDENILESVLTNSDDPGDTFVPLDINEASEDDLLSIPEMSPRCAASIVAYRRNNGIVHSMGQISRVDGMTTEIMSALRRRAVIVEPNDLHIEAISYLSLSPQRVSLFNDACDEYGILNFQRLDVSYRNYELHAVTDKDPGEKSYADFYSVALTAKYIYGFSAVTAGDYTLSLGNGLLFSRAGMVSKSAGPVTPLFTNRAYALRPYRSKGENKFLRGAAFSHPLGPLEISGFGSVKELAARSDDSGSVTSIDYSGLNLSTQSQRENLVERIAGGIVRYESGSVCAGMSAAYFSYDRKFRDYYLSKVLALESFVRLRLDRAGISCELLSDKAVSFSAGGRLDYEDARFAVGIRNLRSKIVQNYSGPLSESFPTNPEQGIYFGATLKPASIAKLGFYYDRFRIISISGEPDRSGEEIFAECYLSLSKKKVFEGSGTVLYLRYKYKTKEDSYVPLIDLPAALTVIAGSKQTARIDFRHKFPEAFSIRVRIERNFLSSGEKGELLLFDSGWRCDIGSIDGRICFYRTDSFRSAFYTVEKDLPRVAEFTLFYGDGARLFLLGSWKLGGLFTIGLKISRDIFNSAREISVGSASKSVTAMTDLSIELRYRID